MMRSTFQFLYVMLLLAFLPGCGAQVIADDGDGERVIVAEKIPTRRDYIRQFYEDRTMTFVYGSQGEDEGEAFKRLLGNLQEQSRQLNMIIKSDREISEAELAEGSVFLIGTPRSNLHLLAALPKLPVSIDSQQISFGGEAYADEEDVMLLTFYPNPWNPEASVGMVTGLEDAAVLSFFQDLYVGHWRRFFRDRWGYEVFRKGKRMLMGHFSSKEENLWEMDREVHWDLAAGERDLGTFKGYTYVAHDLDLSDPQFAKLLARHVDIRNKVESFWGKTSSAKWTVHLYPSVEAKGLKTRNTDYVHLNFTRNEIHLIEHEEFRGIVSELEAMAILRSLVGKASLSAWESGLAVSLTDTWQKKGYRFWAQKLHAAGLLPAPDKLFDEDSYKGLSPIVRSCAAALWVDYLVDMQGKVTFQSIYLGNSSHKPSLRQFERYLSSQWEQMEPAPGAEREFPFLKGFNYAHEGYQIYNGYASAKSTEAISAVSAIGSNAISLIPYTYMRDPKKPSPLPFSHGSGDENDEGLIHSAFEAKKRGMLTVMKPQLWVGRGSWPGDIEMRNRVDWESFAEYYEAWITHYALLAEIHEVDMMCVGVEFAKATLAREQDWIALIRKLRKVYSGPMVYAANWGSEFENLTFWDELDYIGLDCYYPLSKAENPSHQELLKNFERILDKVEKYSIRYQKPVILTEIGFRSIEAPWKQPHESNRGPALSMECQERCYRAVTEALEDENWLAGIFWWKWPSTLENGGPGHQGFTPNGKPAEKVLAEWFRGME